MVPMPEVVVKAEKKLTPEEMRVESVKFLKNHQAEILADEELKQIFEPIYKVLEMLDENLEFRKNMDTSYFETVLEDFLKRSNVVLDEKQREVLTGLASGMMVIYKEMDPRTLWWREMRDQSAEKLPEGFSNLVRQGGFWKILFEPGQESETGGVEELQKMTRQFLVELAKNQSLHAAEPLPFELLKGAEKRKRYAEDGAQYLQKARERSEAPLTGDALLYDICYKVSKGKFEYREFGKIEEMPIRFYKEESGRLFYRDVPANEFVNGNGDVSGGKWQELRGNRDIIKDAPILGISIGGSPRPDSLLYRYTRSGQSVVHFHYDLEKKRMEVAFNHANFDGMQGKEWAFAFASVVEAKNRSRLELELEVAPPTQVHSMLDKRELDDLILLYYSDNDKKRAEISEKLVFSFGLSDFSIRKEMPVEDYQKIEAAVKAINEVWYKSLKEKLEQIISGDPTLTESMKGFITNKIGLSKMTVLKYIDLMARQYWGTTVSCAAPIGWEARLGYVLEQKMYEDVLESVADYKNGKAGEVFGGVDDKDLRRSLDMAVKATMSEYAAYYGLDASALNIIKSSTKEFRGPAEVSTVVINEEALEGSEIVFMASHLMDGFIKDKKGNVVELAGFGSAFTSMEEMLFAIAYSDIVLKVGEEKTLRQNFRNRLNSQMVGEMMLVDKDRMVVAVNELAVEIGRVFGKNPEEIVKRLVGDGGLVDKLIGLDEVYYPEERGRDGKANMFLLAHALEASKTNWKFLLRYPDPKVFEEIQWLLIAGQWDLEKRFNQACVAGAEEIATRLKLG